MPSYRSLTELVTASFRLADLDQLGTGAAPIATADAEQRVQESVASLYEMILDQGGEDLLSVRTTLTAAQVSPSILWTVALPDDFHKLLELSVEDGDRYRPVYRIRPEDEAFVDRMTGDVARFYSMDGVGTVQGANLTLFPAPSSAVNFRLRYVPEAPLIGDVTLSPEEPVGPYTIALPNRWWQWIEYDCATSHLVRLKLDHRATEKRRDEIGAAIVRSAASTDRYQQRVIEDRRGVLRGRLRNIHQRDRDRGIW